MTETEQPPEMAVIEDRRLATPKMSVAKAAKAAGISEGRWRQLAKGYQQVTAETRVMQKAPDDTLARMAMAVGASADDIEAAGREAAAKTMRESSQALGRGLSSPFPNVDKPPHEAHFSRAERLLQHARTSAAHGNYLAAIHGLEGAQSTVELLIDRITETAIGGNSHDVEIAPKPNASTEAVKDEEAASRDDSELAGAMTSAMSGAADRLLNPTKKVAVDGDENPEETEEVPS